MQIKRTLMFHLTPGKNGKKSSRQRKHILGKIGGKENPHSLLLRFEVVTDNLETSEANSHKTKTKPTI